MRLRTTGRWKQAADLLGALPAAVRRAKEEVVREEAEFFRQQIVAGIERQAPGGRAFRRLSAATILARRARGIRGDRALLATGELVRSIQVTRGRDGYFVGVSVRGGRGVVDLARLHEEGFGPVAVRMTPRMRRFLFGVVLRGADRSRSPGGGRGVVVLRVPARPFVRPTFEAHGRAGVAVPRLARRYARALRGLVRGG